MRRRRKRKTFTPAPIPVRLVALAFAREAHPKLVPGMRMCGLCGWATRTVALECSECSTPYDENANGN